MSDTMISDLAERSVLGGCLRWNAAISDAAVILKAGDFRIDAHQRIWPAIMSLWSDGKPVDAVGIAELLKRSGEIENIGGYSYLGDLWDHEPTGALVSHHAKIVKDASILRQLVVAGQTIMNRAASPDGPASEILEASEREIFAIAQVGAAGQTYRLSQAVEEAKERYDARKEGRGSVGVLSGFRDLDDLTSGFHDGELSIVAARTSVGKTSFALTTAYHAAVNRGQGVMFASLEMSRVELAERLLCIHSGANSHHMRAGTLTESDVERVARAARIMESTPMFIDDTAVQSVTRIGANARRLKSRHNIRLVVVDYLQLIDPESRKEPRHEQIAGITRRLKALARELELPVIALAQLSRAADGESTPRLSHLRESGAQEQDSDVVLLLHRPEQDSGPIHTIEAHVAKQRNGPTGTVSLAFRRACVRFENFEPEIPAYVA